jgi:hypothetical protein
MFSTDAAGSVEEEIAEESQGLLQEFVDYIKSHKVVVLEDLASNFGLRVEVGPTRARGTAPPASCAELRLTKLCVATGGRQSCARS